MERNDSAIQPFLTFAGQAEEAIAFYVSVFPDSSVDGITRFGPGERGQEGKVLNGSFRLMGQPFMALDIEPEYRPEPSWAVSLFINCRDEAEFDGLFAGLSADGQVLMGPEPVYDLSKVAWITDRFGVTWQLVCH